MNMYFNAAGLHQDTTIREGLPLLRAIYGNKEIPAQIEYIKWFGSPQNLYLLSVSFIYTYIEKFP